MDQRTYESALPLIADDLQGPELSVVLPTYNERANVAPMVARLESALRGERWEIIFVDDDSRDQTFEEVRRISLQDRRVRCIRRVGRRGLAGAVLEGAMAAQAPYVVVMDADQQHDETILPQMLQALREGGADVAIGTRYCEGGSADGFSSKRHLLSRAGSVVARRLLGVTASDPLSGFFAVRRDVVDRVADEIATDGFKVLLDLLTTRRLPLRIAEVPYGFRAREHGESKLGVRVGLDFLALLLSRLTANILPQRFLLFCVVGIGGVLVHLAVLGLAQTAGLEFTAAQTLAAVVAMASNFWLNNNLTYRSETLHGWRAARGFVLFLLISAFGFVTNVGLASWLLADGGEWWIAGLAGAAMSAVWNYAVSATLVWGRK